MTKVSARLVMLAFMSLAASSAIAGDRGYTCGELLDDNKNKTVLSGKNPHFKSVESFLQLNKEMSLRDFPVRVAESYFDKMSEEGNANAFRLAINVYDDQLRNSKIAMDAINDSAKEAGSLTAFFTEICSDKGIKRDTLIDSIFTSYMLSAGKVKNKFPEAFKN